MPGTDRKHYSDTLPPPPAPPVQKTRDRILFYAGAALLAAGVNVLPLMVFRAPLPDESFRNSDRRYAVMLSDKTMNDSTGAFKDISYYLRYGEPSYSMELIHPYSGTAAFRKIETRTSPVMDASPSARLLFSGESSPSDPSPLPLYPLRMPFEFPSGTVPDGLAVRTPKKEAIVACDRIALCTTDSGLILKNVFSGRDSDAAESLLKKKYPVRPTLFRINFPERAELPPEIRLLVSCGTPELDLLASGVLAVYAARFSPDEPNRFRTVSVDWRGTGKGALK